MSRMCELGTNAGGILKHEYHEGPDALEKFNKLATKLFRASKPAAKETPKPAPKPKKASKG